MSKIFNADELRVMATVPVGNRPTGVAVDVHGRVFVTNSGSNSLSVIDPSPGATTATVNVGFFPESVATDPQFGTFVANSGDRTVSVLNRLNAVVSTLRVGGVPGLPPNMARVAVDHIFSRAYVTNRSGDRVAIVRTSTVPPVVMPVPIDIPRPLGVAVDAVDHRLYVTQPDLGTVSAIDHGTLQKVATFPVRERPTGIAVDSPRRRLYVADSGFTTVSVIDLTTGAVTDVDVGAHPVAVAVDPRGNAYVSHSSGSVKVIDAGSGTVTATIPVGAKPEGVAFEPHTRRVYVANSGDGTLSVLDLSGGH
ncbi:YncE family protein [Streptomyces sp. PRKS01-65]|nr:YncE family protein [Streptomyces harenosi]NEY31819.1 YncE family protein [Streptomyces harenosi]